MSPRKESKRYSEVITVFLEQEKPITLKDAIVLLEGKEMSARTMQEYVATMVKNGDLEKYVEKDDKFVVPTSSDAFLTPLYAVPGIVILDAIPKNENAISVCVANLKRVLQGEGSFATSVREVAEKVRESFPGWIEKAREFTESRPFVAGFMAGVVVTVLLAMLT